MTKYFSNIPSTQFKLICITNKDYQTPFVQTFIRWKILHSSSIHVQHDLLCKISHTSSFVSCIFLYHMICIFFSTPLWWAHGRVFLSAQHLICVLHHVISYLSFMWFMTFVCSSVLYSQQDSPLIVLSFLGIPFLFGFFQYIGPHLFSSTVFNFYILQHCTSLCFQKISAPKYLKYLSNVSINSN